MIENNNLIIEYVEGMQLEPNKKYISNKIVFSYNPDSEKPYVLNNGIRLDHIPTNKDIGLLNLKADLTKDERRELSIKAGIASGESRRKRKTFKESMQLFLSMEATEADINNLPPDIQKRIKEEGISLTQEDIINLKALELSKLGSEKHMIFTRDTAGEKPTDKQEVTANIMTEGDRLLIEKISARLNL